eukprot:CAMPEP_0172411360 /NCGR_PEP_ID=MMETSP1061-20121228/77357_1 /TAXON_ID=37318 /ORGANISM="Pseudo-nitzschia pungens, Strain cf. pungens" /LENGTH=145 /DNA_ID=CAMNT_0013147569 /DNA_START=75 /DNA_END=512 /DNA_ORIENTATION=+
MTEDKTSSAKPDSGNEESSSSSSSLSSSSDASFLATITSGFQSAAASDDEANHQDTAVKLGLYWDEWSRCIGSSYQGDSLYRHGKLDSCGKQWGDLKLAAEARLTQWRDPERAEKLLQSTYYYKRTTISPTAGVIWELKERPGWN